MNTSPKLDIAVVCAAMTDLSKLTHYEIVLLVRDQQDHAYRQERLFRLRYRGLNAVDDLTYAIRHNCAAGIKAWSALACMWFSEWLMLRNPVIGRKCVVLAPARK